MKVLYLTSMENTLNNDIHANQVLNLQNHGIDYCFLFLSPKFILNKAGFSINNNRFDNKVVKEYKLPILSYHMGMHVFMIPYFLLISLFPFLFTLKREKPEIVHCRNMLSTLLATFCKLCFRKKYKIVCDPRSVYVEELVITNTFKYSGFNYNKWKKLEAWIYKNSDACIGLSHNFMTYLQQFNRNSYYIPAVVNDNYHFDEERRKELRSKFELSDNDLVCCYIGSIGAWHSVDNFFKCLDLVREKLNKEKNIKIVFLSGNQSVCEEINKRYSKNELLKIGRVAPSEILNYLLISDLGLVPGSEKEGYCYDLLYDTMISSKAEEYIGAGLPILVHPRIKSLVKMVEENDLGVIMSSNTDFCCLFDRSAISAYGHNQFSVSSVITAYRHLYESLLLDK